MNCQLCGGEGPTRYVAFHQNIGAVVRRFQKSTKGDLCKRCIHRTFWKYSAVNLFLGWWGLISVIVTPVFLINNIVRYVACLPMPAVASARRPPKAIALPLRAVAAEDILEDIRRRL
jgi:hypothetical protein